MFDPYSVDPTPALPPDGAIFIKFKPNGWASGDGVDHIIWAIAGTTGGVLQVQRYSDNMLYVGFHLVYGGGAGDNRINVSDAGLFIDGEWCDLLFQWGVSDNTSVMYVNGTEVGSHSIGTSVDFLSNTSLQVGGILNSTSARGDVAEWAVFDHKLDTTERAALFDQQKPPECLTGLLHYVKILGDASPEPAEVGAPLVLGYFPVQSTHPALSSCLDSQTIDPLSISLTVTLPAPAVQFPPSTLTPDSIALSVTLPAPTITSAPLSLTPSAIALTVTLPPPALNFRTAKGLRLTISDRLAEG